MNRWCILLAGLVVTGTGCGGGSSESVGKIVFVRQAEGGLYTINDDGTGLRAILAKNPEKLAQDPAWSPDGTKIAFGRSCGVWIVNADGTGLREVAPARVGGCAGEPAWSPDGTRLAFPRRATTPSRPGAVYVMNATGGAERAVSQRTITGRSPSDAFPSWSPDGKRIAFSRTDFDKGIQATVWVVNVDGTGARAFPKADPQIADAMPVWSADGQQIAFGHMPRSTLENPGDIMHVYVANADGSNQTDLTKDPGPIGSRYPAWSPSGSNIAFIRVGLWVMDADGSNRKQLTSDLNDWAPDYWQPGS